MELSQLLKFLESDPNNLQLLGDAAAAALDAGQSPIATRMLERYEAIAALPADIANLAGLVALSSHQLEEATRRFEAALAHDPANPEVRFNLAWARAGLLDWVGVSALIDSSVVEAAPRSAALKIHAMHHLGEVEDALAWGAEFVERFPDDQSLMGALAVVAIDAEEMDLARAYGERAGEIHEGLSTLGMLKLNEHEVAEAGIFFDRALKVYPTSARAHLGKGLGLLVGGDPKTAARHIDQGAEIFGDHLGSWVAAGWAYFVGGDYVNARARFETALALDNTFAETHGGLAVLDVMEGHIESARRRTEIGLRLDKMCFSAILARTLLLTHDGDPATAERLRNIALNSPIGPGGQTIAQAMVGLAGRRGR